MIKGLYAAASAMVANMKRQNTLSHNASNLETVGFKQILTSANDYIYSSTSYSPGNITQSDTDFIGYLGLGSTAGEEVTDFDEGGIKFTGNPYDFAINGNGFFRIQTPEGEERYTRDGRFLVDAEHNLVTAADGYFVLNTQGEKINLPEGSVEVTADGTIQINGEATDQIGLAVFSNMEEDIEREGSNYFSAINPPIFSNQNTSIAQCSLEMSNVNISQLTTQMLMVNRSYQAASRVISNQDQLLNKILSTLGQF